MTKLLIFGALAALAATATTTATANAGDMTHETVQLTIPYGDLDLNREAGAKTMMFRIRSAATNACGGQPNIREMKERKIFKSCFRQAVAETVDQLGAPLVTANFEREVAEGRYS